MEKIIQEKRYLNNFFYKWFKNITKYTFHKLKL